MFPNLRGQSSEEAEVPSWAREVAASLTTRPSRASSLVSTRTRISTTTLQEDARSIDLNIGGQYFRISRDGSKVTSTNLGDSLPPYPGLSNGATPSEQIPDTLQSWGGENVSTTTQTEEVSAVPTARRHLGSASIGHIAVISDVLDPFVVSRASGNRAVPHDQQAAASSDSFDTKHVLNRNPSYKTGEETISVARTPKQRRTVSHNDLPEARRTPNERSPITSPLRRRNGVRLPTLVTSLTDNRSPDDGSPITAISSSPRSRFTRSAGPALPSDNADVDSPKSPVYYGKAATGVFPTKSQVLQPAENLLWAKTVILRFWRNYRQGTVRDAHEMQDLPTGRAAAEQIGLPTSTNALTGDLPEDHPPQAMDSENDISNHYTRMIRFIDRDHRQALHARDKDMADLREKLHEKDIVYRQELKARDFMIEDLKKRLSHLEGTMEAKLERARYEVEDTWEKRWKDRDHHLMERMRRMEAESHKAMETVIAEKEEMWRVKYEELEKKLGV